MAAMSMRWGVAVGVGGLLAATAVVLAAGGMDRPAQGPEWFLERKSDAFTEALDRAYWVRAWATSIAYSRTSAGTGSFRGAAPQFERAVELLAETSATGATVLPEDALVDLRKVLVGALRTAERSYPLKSAPEAWNREDPGKLMDEGLADLVRQARQSLGSGELTKETTALILSAPSEPGKWGMPVPWGASDTRGGR